MTYSTTSIPAPVKGLNDRDSIADMDPTYALVMENWWPYPSYVGVRKGSQNHVTDIPATVETLIEYLPTSGASTLFAIAGTSIYNVTTAGAVGAPVHTGLSNARFESAQITTPGGSYLYIVNGFDLAHLWNGTTWQAITNTGSPSITGVATSLFCHVQLFKNRLFFTEKNSMRVWYLPVNSVGGSASQLDLGSVFRLGGSIQACYTWTIDAGSGSDDHLVIISTNGEVAVYSGTDPSSATDWRLVGVFTLGRPLGRRCGIKFGGDLAINCMEGVFPLGKGLLSASVDRRVSLTDSIQNSVREYATQLSNEFGWQLCLFPDANMLILNVPRTTGGSFQYAQNTLTGAWCTFEGWQAECWLNAATGLYYGDGNSVKKAWVGNFDVGLSITASLCPAFGTFGSKSLNKYFTMVRPYLTVSGTPSFLYGLSTDYEVASVNGTLSYSPPTGMVWGSMTWGTMVWGSSLRNIRQWKSVGKVCNSAAIYLKTQNNGGEVRLSSIDYVFQKSTGVL